MKRITHSISASEFEDLKKNGVHYKKGSDRGLKHVIYQSADPTKIVNRLTNKPMLSLPLNPKTIALYRKECKNWQSARRLAQQFSPFHVPSHQANRQEKSKPSCICAQHLIPTYFYKTEEYDYKLRDRYIPAGTYFHNNAQCGKLKAAKEDHTCMCYSACVFRSFCSAD